MKRRFSPLLVAAALIATLAVPATAVDLVTFTGDVEVDFNTVLHPELVGKVMNFPDIVDDGSGAGCLDQPLGPNSFNPANPLPPIPPSGFNIESVLTVYDCTTDTLYIGLHVCGDRMAWDADINDNILTWDVPAMNANFSDNGPEDYALNFDVIADLSFVKNFGVEIASVDGGANVHVGLNGPDPTTGLAACAYLVGGPAAPTYACAPSFVFSRAATGNEKDIEVRVTGIRAKYGLSGGSPLIELQTRSGATGDVADEDITDQQIPLTCTPCIEVTKQVACTADGTFGPSVNVVPGTPVYYKVTVTNCGDEALKDVSINDVATSPGGACTGCIEIRELPSNNLLPCADIAVGNLAVGASQSYLIKFGTDSNFSTQDTPIDCTNTATATGTGNGDGTGTGGSGIVVVSQPASATVNVLVPSITCATLVDDNDGFTHASSTLNLPCDGPNVASVYYKLCVHNSGEVPVDFGTGPGPCSNFVSSLLDSSLPGISGLPVDVCGLLRAQIPGGILAPGATACITVGPLSFDKCELCKNGTTSIVNNFTASGLAGDAEVCGTKQLTTGTCPTTVNVCCAPAITITKEVACSTSTADCGSGTYGPAVDALRGAYVCFKMVVTNTGCDDLKDVVITDTLADANGSLIPCVACCTGGNTIPGTINIGSLAKGASQTFYCKFQTDPAFAIMGTAIDATNTASVAGTGVSSGQLATAGPVNATVNVLVPKIECTKYVSASTDFSAHLQTLDFRSPGCVSGDKPVFYELCVINSGDVAVDFTKGDCVAHFADTLLSQVPPGITINSPADLVAAFMGQLTNGVLPAGGNVCVVVSTTFNEPTLCLVKDEWTNIFSACGFATDSGICLPDVGGEKVSTGDCLATVHICCPCSIEITKGVSCSPQGPFGPAVKALRGAPVYFKVCVKNSGTDTINGIVITDTMLSPNGAFLSCAECKDAVTGDPIACIPGAIAVGTLAAGAEKCIVCKVLTDPNFSTIGVDPDITNTAFVDGTCATSQVAVHAGPVSAYVDLLVPGITCEKLVDDDSNLITDPLDPGFDPLDPTPPGHVLNAGDPATPVTNAYFKLCVTNNGEVDVDFTGACGSGCPNFSDPKLATLDALIPGTGVDVCAAMLGQLPPSQVLGAGQTVCQTFGPIVFDQGALCPVIDQWLNQFSACGIAKQADICLPDTGGETVDTGLCEALVTLCPPTLKQVYCGLSCDPRNGVNHGYGGITGDTIAAVPGVFAIDPGNAQWSNWVAAAAATPPVPYTLTSVVLRKVAPRSVDCPLVFKGETKVQSGLNIQLWWPLMYEMPGTTFTLTVNYDTLAPWNDGTGLKIHHSQTWSWSVKASLEDLKRLLVLFHQLPLGTHEVPLISDESLYPVLLAKLDHVMDLITAGQNGEAGRALDEFILEVEDACITSFIPTKPNVTGAGTGIANTCENPACCKIQADVTWVQNELKLLHP